MNLRLLLVLALLPATAPAAPRSSASYTIATSADSTDGRDGTWHEVVRVTGNTARTRVHRFPFAGARWVHFLGMTGIVLFLIVHVTLALLVPKTIVAMVKGSDADVHPDQKGS